MKKVFSFIVLFVSVLFCSSCKKADKQDSQNKVIKVDVCVYGATSGGVHREG